MAINTTPVDSLIVTGEDGSFVQVGIELGSVFIEASDGSGGGDNQICVDLEPHEVLALADALLRYSERVI